MQALTILLSGAIADALGAYGASMAGTTGQVAGLALETLIRRRIGSARDILIDEIKRGDKTLHSVGDVEEVVAVTYRYARAAQEGAARLNLRLMAKVIAGQAHLGNLVADEFLYYADVLAVYGAKRSSSSQPCIITGAGWSRQEALCRTWRSFGDLRSTTSCRFYLPMSAMQERPRGRLCERGLS